MNVDRGKCLRSRFSFLTAVQSISQPDLKIFTDEEEPPQHLQNNLTAITWNIASPNSNPFEYWCNHEDAEYSKLMCAVHDWFACPEMSDCIISNIFSEDMYQSMRHRMSIKGQPNLEQLDKIWYGDISKRNSISGFMSDTSLGQKRLISMPDRVTSCIRMEYGEVIYRPSAITGSAEDMNTLEQWWAAWTDFMFNTPIRVRGTKYPTVFSRLTPIPRAKYPALSPEEEAISVPLQALSLAVFDAILIHMLCAVAPRSWQPLKRSLHRALHEGKAAACVAVLRRHYAHADVVFIQEASDAFAAAAWTDLDRLVLRPPRADAKRSQVSLILVHRARFRADTARDLTDRALADPACAAVDRADLCVAEILSADGRPHLLASFHGDRCFLSYVFNHFIFIL
jgi:hypothetical protein